MGPYDVFVGRDADLSRLWQALSSARARSGAVAVVAGPAGIGKTRLLTELAARATEHGDLVLWGRCSDDPGAPDHWPWMQIIGACVRATPAATVARLGSGLAHLVQGVPDLASWVDAGPLPPEGSTRLAFFDAAVALLRTVATDRALLVLLDDAHWADEGSLRLLDLLSRSVADTAVAVVVSHRELDAAQRPEVASRLADIARRGLRLDVDGLSREATRALIANRSGTEPAGRLVDDLHALTGGNPFFIDEAVRLLAVGGLDALGSIPRTVLGTVRGVLDTLPERELDVLRGGAVAGAGFDDELVAAVTGRPDGAVRAALVELHRRGLLRAGDRPGRWAFSHALLREALLDTIDPATAAELHWRAGRTLLDAGAGPERLGEVAAHLVEAGSAAPSGLAGEVCAAAGREASARLSHAEAARWFGQAVELVNRDPAASGPGRFELLQCLGESQIRAGQAASALATFVRARTLAKHLDDAVGFARSVAGSAEARRRGPGWETLLADLRPLLDEALTRLDAASLDEPVLRAQLLGHVAACHAVSLEPDLAWRAAGAAAEHAARSGSATARRAALVGQRWAAVGPAPLATKRQLTEQLMELAVESDDPEARWFAARWRLYDGLDAGDPDLLARGLATTTTVAEQLGDPDLRVDALIQHGTVAMLEGRWSDLDALHERATEISAGADIALEPMLGQQLFASRERGDLQVDVLRLILEANPLPLYHALVCWGNVNLGRLDDAAADLDRFCAAFPIDDLDATMQLPTVLAMLSEAVAALGDVDRARSIHRRLLPVRDQCVVAGIGPYVWTGSTEHYLGMLATTFGDHGAAAEHLDRALDVHRRLGARPWVLRTAEARARLDAAAGDTAAARAALDEVVTAAEAAGMPVLAASARRHLDDLGGPARAAAPGERWELRRTGDAWSLTTPRQRHHLRNRKGLAYLAELLARPGQEVHVLAFGDDTGTVVEAGLGPQLDGDAKAALRARVEDLREQIAEGEAWGDAERVSRAEAELEAIGRELAAAVGLGGRDRPVGDAAERARLNVTKAIRSAIEVIRRTAPEVGDHLSQAVRTGSYCAYEPAPSRPVHWEISLSTAAPGR